MKNSLIIGIALCIVFMTGILLLIDAGCCVKEKRFEDLEQRVHDLESQVFLNDVVPDSTTVIK